MESHPTVDNPSQRRASRRVLVAAALIGLAWFGFQGGFRALPPTEYLWLMEGDQAQQYLGWLFFRDAPWEFPLGSLPNYLHPVGTTVGFTDSIPWLAAAAKLTEAWLPPDFQYFGIWLAFCFAAQGVASALLLAAWSDDDMTTLLGVTFFVTSPVLLRRLGHSSLCAHALLIMAIWLSTLARSSLVERTRRAAALTVIAAGVHPYLAAMVVVLTVATPLPWPGESWRGLRMRIALAGPLVLACAFVTALLLGYWQRDIASAGFEFLSADATALFNPQDWSVLIPGWSVTSEQEFEGFGYVGSGVLALILVSFAERRIRGWHFVRVPATIWASCGLLGVYALSSRVTVLGWTLMTADGFYDLFGQVTRIFRVSGRFIWPLHYCVIFWSVVQWTSRRNDRGRGWTTAILAACLTLQLLDMSNVRQSHVFLAKEFRPIRSDLWSEASAGRKHVVLYPPQIRDGAGREAVAGQYDADHYLRYAHWAGVNGMTCNSGYVARALFRKVVPYYEGLKDEVERGRLRRDTVYVIQKGEDENRVYEHARCFHEQDAEVCVVDGNDVD